MKCQLCIDQSLFGTFYCFIWKCQAGFSSIVFSAAPWHVHIQTVQQVEDAFCSVLTSKYDNTIYCDTFPGVTSRRVYVHLALVFYLTTESVTNGCVSAWWSTAIALLGTKLLQDYIDSSKKSCFNKAHIIWETKKDVQLLIERLGLSSWRKIVF